MARIEWSLDVMDRSLNSCEELRRDERLCYLRVVYYNTMKNFVRNNYIFRLERMACWYVCWCDMTKNIISSIFVYAGLK